jgi:chromosomal replication initiator protein
VTKDEKEIVSAVHRALAGRVGAERYAVWFGRGVRMEPCGTTLRIAAADTFRLDYLRRMFRGDLLAAARSVAGSELQLEFILDPQIAALLAPASGGASEAPKGPCSADAPPRTEERDQTRPAIVPLALPQQAEFPAPAAPARRPFASLHEFIASEPNRVAASAAITAAERPGTYSPLTLIGPPGSGKTHLLEGIWRHARSERKLARVIYLPAEQFTNQFLDAIRQSGTPLFRRKIRDAEMLLIDDVQFFAGKQSTQVELVHTIDALLRAGRQLVLGADRSPAELSTIGPEIGARLAGGLVCRLEPADYATRLGILQQLAARQHIEAPADVLAWLASQLDGDARHLAGALNRLRAAREAHEQPIDLPFAEMALADLIHAGRRPVRLPDIVEAVADVFGVSQSELQSSSKAASATLPRMLIMFLARKWTRAALSEISRTLGRKSHSTVVSAQHKVTEWLADGKTVSLAHSRCRVEDAIQRVESRLRLG